MPRFLWLLLLLMGGAANSQHIFSITDASKIFEAKVVMVNCADGKCQGPGYIKIIHKQTNEHLLTIHSNELTVFYPRDSVLEDGRSTIVKQNKFLLFKDVNFDGQEDLVLITGDKWDVRLYDSARSKFYSNRVLDKLMKKEVYRMRTDSSKGYRLMLYTNNGSHDTRTEYIWKKGQPQKVFALSVWQKYDYMPASRLRSGDLDNLTTEGKVAEMTEVWQHRKKSSQYIMIVEVNEWKNGRRHSETRRYKTKDYMQLNDPYWKL